LLTSNYLPHERKAFAEFILGDFLVGLSTASADSDSNSESVGYLDLIDALTPTLVWLNFSHLEGLLWDLKGSVWIQRCFDQMALDEVVPAVYLTAFPFVEN
jgi:hypothetical protein